MARIFVFPGQGSQHPGMAKDWFDQFSKAKQVFEEASDATGLHLKKLCFEGSDADLKQTSVTQPAILTASVAIFESLKTDQELNPKEIFFAGHSLGEYSALVCAEALPLAEAAKLVRRRGELMQEAVPEGVGAMAALVFKPGISGENIALELCAKAVAQSGKSVSVANFNSPEQIVISGYKEAVAAAEQIAKVESGLGVRKVILLNVSAPFHCELMTPAAQGLSESLKKVDWKNQTGVRYIPNILGSAVTLEKASDCAERLEKQITGSVLWAQSMRKILEENISEHLEIGPGTVLTGLMKRMAALSEKGASLKLNNTSTVDAYKSRG